MARKLFSPTRRRGLIILAVVAAGAAIILTALLVLQTVKAPSLNDNQSAHTDGETVTISGVMMCLPHKNTNGPQTDECAFGLKSDDGKYYGLHDTDPTYKNVSGVPMNKHVKVSGKFKAGTSNIYPTIGTIEVTQITQ